MTRSVGTILLAKRGGVIPVLREVLDDLRAHGTYIGESLYREALAAAGEE